MELTALRLIQTGPPFGKFAVLITKHFVQQAVSGGVHNMPVGRAAGDGAHRLCGSSPLSM